MVEMTSKNNRYLLYKALVKLSSDVYCQDLPEIGLISAIIISGIYDDDYLEKEEFWYHCALLRLNDTLVMKLINKIKNGILIDENFINNNWKYDIKCVTSKWDSSSYNDGNDDSVV